MQQLDDRELREVTKLSDAIWDFALSQVGNDDTATQSDLALAALALGAATERMKRAALDDAMFTGAANDAG